MTSWAAGGRSWKGGAQVKVVLLGQGLKVHPGDGVPLHVLPAGDGDGPVQDGQGRGWGSPAGGSAFIWLPSPVQVGQAPKGLLKENIRGESSSMEMPQSSQA